jgi:glycosyltransferase involved in cell wall biosynthesis
MTGSAAPEPWVSIVINTCNRAGFLRHCLAGYLIQTPGAGPFEVIVADDGSTDGTGELVGEFARQAPFPVRHVWHEHLGHRRTTILNRGVAAARAPYILFTDCDAIPAANFVETHRRLRTPGRMLCGGYVRLTPEETALVTPEFVREKRFEAFLTPKRRRELFFAHLKNLIDIGLKKRTRPHNMGLNYSVEREALRAINGYDEEFRGWGGADGDVRRRLFRIGVRPKSAWRQAVVFHQFHDPEPTKPHTKYANHARARRPDAPCYAVHGLDRHLGAPAGESLAPPGAERRGV